MIGAYNTTPFYNTDQPVPLKAYTVSGASNWTFDLDQFAFGYTNTTNNTNIYANLTTDDYNSAFLTLGHPGIGLPSPMFEPFVEYLQNLTGNIWNCEMKYGYACYAPVRCLTFAG